MFFDTKVIQPFMCFRVNQVYMFLSQSSIFIRSPRWIFSGGFRCIFGGFSYLPGGTFTTRSHPGKVLKIWHFIWWVKQSPPGHRDRVFLANIKLLNRNFSDWRHSNKYYLVKLICYYSIFKSTWLQQKKLLGFFYQKVYYR